MSDDPVEHLEDGELREAALSALVDGLVTRRRRGELRAADVRQAAAGFDVAERTLWRWLSAGRTPERHRPSARRFVLTAELRDCYLALGGNVSAVWRDAHKRGLRPPPLRTLQAAFARELVCAERASARLGEPGRRAHGLYLRYEAPYRNAAWQADHKQLPVLVLTPGARRPRRPWVTLFVDDFSRAIMGWAISVRPSSAEVLAALRDAVLIDPERGPFGGVPDRLRWDRGLEFAAAAVCEAGLALGIDVDPAAAYTPTQKGKVERLNGTVAGMFVATLPAYTGGPRDVRGRLEHPGQPLSLSELVVSFDRWARSYNSSHAHSSLAGRTPLERYTTDPTPLRRVEPEAARRLLVARKWAKVRRDGVHHDGLAYVSVALTELVGESVELCFAPHDQRSVEVYWRGAWLCTAHPQGTLSAAEQQQIMAERRAWASELRRRQRHARRRAHTRLAPATASAPAPAEVTRLAGDTRTTHPRSTPRDQRLRAAARTDLLLPAGVRARARDPSQRQPDGPSLP